MTDRLLLDRAVLEQALEALGDNEWGTPHHDDSVSAAIRAVLEQPPVEPQPYLWYDPETDMTWTHEALAKVCSMEGLIPLYRHPPERAAAADDVQEAIRNERKACAQAVAEIGRTQHYGSPGHTVAIRSVAAIRARGLPDTKAKHCDDCSRWYAEMRECAKGHQPRLYHPRSVTDPRGGHKRRCTDFQGNP